MCVYAHTPVGAHGGLEKGVRYHGVGAAGSCEPPAVGAGEPNSGPLGSTNCYLLSHLCRVPAPLFVHLILRN